jgi:hypothetical protein
MGRGQSLKSGGFDLVVAMLDENENFHVAPLSLDDFGFVAKQLNNFADHDIDGLT